METQNAETIEKTLAVAAESALQGLRAQIEEYLGTVGTELAGYVPAVYTTDPAEAKRIRAAINSRVAEMKDKRLTMERTWAQPIEPLKARLVEAEKAAKQKAQEVDEAVKAKEAQDWEEKLRAIEAYHESKGGRPDFLGRIMGADWKNKGKTLKSIYAEIDKRLEEYAQEEKTINEIPGAGPEDKAILLDEYHRTLNLAATIDKWNRILSIRAEAARAKEAQPTPDPEPTDPAPAEINQPAQEIPGENPEKTRNISGSTPEVDPIMSFRLIIRWKKSDCKALRAWMDARGLTYEKEDV